MKFVFVFALFALASYSQAYYEGSLYVVKLKPQDLIDLKSDDKADSMWLIQYYNGSDAFAMRNGSVVFENVAKCLSGYVHSGAIDIGTTELLKYINQLKRLPSYQMLGYYKYIPNYLGDIEEEEELTESTVKQFLYFFDERRMSRFVETKWNYELGRTDMDDILNESLKSWLVIYYHPQCEKCKSLAKIWQKLVYEFKEKISFGSVDNLEFTVLSNVEDYPVIKFSPMGKKKNKEETYEGDLTYEALRQYVLGKIKTPKVKQITGVNVIGPCLKRKHCIITFIPLLLYCDADCRSNVLGDLNETSKKYNTRSWIWLWSEYQDQGDLEQVFSIQESQHPIVLVLNVHGSSYFKVEYPDGLNAEELEDVAGRIDRNIGFDNILHINYKPDIKTAPIWRHSKEEL
ncbi:PREDICTED: probable protein disulfide-isomerase A6 [Nicrophorus vespilloides]|uniref:Probable protein disulfide-isomerase A6 n=1 Tax=Nicrophorus vespilloides TaxID=110193 RepID=A0ABM1MHN3_NICVS|nr:PREDICTED: probable protein disulfide-isomerase A6 [Nicrophorus vespilloides]